LSRARDGGGGLLLGVALVAATLVAIGGLVTPAAEPRRIGVLGAIPADAALIATLDLPKLRQAGLVGSAELGALAPIAECGFDPARHVERLAVALPATSGDEAELGIAAFGSIDAAMLSGCVRSAIQRRGGTPVTSRLGSFETLRDAAHRGGGEIALRDGGPLLHAGGSWLRAMIDAADGRVPSAEGATSAELHRALRRSVGADAAVVASWTPAAGWLARLGGVDEVRGPAAEIRAAALSIEVGERIRLRAVVGCATPEAAGAIARFLNELDESAGAALIERLIGVALLDALRAKAVEREVRIDLDLGVEQARTLGRRLAGLPAPGPAPGGAEPGDPQPAARPAPPVPDEVIPAPKRP
jgi:hypothetical protein